MADFAFLSAELDQIRKQGRWRELVSRTTNGIHFTSPDGREIVNFGSNDYLGLAADRVTDPEVSCGSGASALICGWTDAHQQLAEKLAAFEGTEAVVLFPCGYSACSGTIATLAGPDDLILSDQLNHASLIDGCRLANATCVVYPHRDLDTVARELEDRRSHHRRLWIVTDTVFSMDGHVAPLVELCELADRYRAHVVVDEAHATGVLGNQGTGLCEALGVKDRVDIRIGTLSKAIGAQGGFVAGPRIVIDYLINRCRSLIFSTALAPPLVAAASRAIDTVVQQPERRQRLHRMSAQLRQGLGLNVPPVEQLVPIVPVMIGEDGRAVDAAQRLFREGFYVPAIRPPTVPAGTSRLRVSLSAAHDESRVRELAAALQR